MFNDAMGCRGVWAAAGDRDVFWYVSPSLSSPRFGFIMSERGVRKSDLGREGGRLEAGTG
jgi:hypothetical protein